MNKRIETPHINKNDCWNLVLSRATGKSYDEVRDELKEYIDENISLPHKYLCEYLIKNGYEEIYQTQIYSTCKVKKFVKLSDGINLIIGSYDPRKELHHLSYARNKRHFTTSKTNKSFNDRVVSVWAKI